MKIVDMMLDTIFPKRCPVCDEVVGGLVKNICDDCKNKFEYVTDPYCLKCGRELTNGNESLCEYCRKCSHEYEYGRSLFVYNEELKESIYRFKYSNRPEYAAYYGQIAAERFGKWIYDVNPDALIPIPLHKSKFKKRGYNQALLLAKEIGNVLNIPVYENALIRDEKTNIQKGLDREQRQNNLKKALKMNPNVVKLSTVILVDDICTTGSTIDAAAYVLKEAGVKHIYYIVLGIGE